MMLSLHRVATGAFVAAFSLAGCSSVTDMTKQMVTRSETAVAQAQQTIGNSESGALELQRARDQLAQAKEALAKGDGQRAERGAQQAQLDAELAVVKAQSATARKAADELLASIKMLRQESERATAAPR
jgi:hypothetical protein